MDASSTRTAFLKIVSSSSSSTHLFLAAKLIRNPQPLNSSHSRYPLYCPRLMLPLSRSNSLTNLNCKSSHFEDLLAPTTTKCSSNSLSLIFTRNFIMRPRFFADSSFGRSSNVHFPIFSRSPISPSSKNLPFLKMGGTRNAFTSTVDEKYHVWHREFNPKPVDRPFGLAVVLLGWLGAERKHLNRYAEWYASRGIQPITFVVSVMDLLGFDAGSSIEQSLVVLSSELMVWLMDREEDGRERRLLVHTFSNTGWFAYVCHLCGSFPSGKSSWKK